MNLSRIIITNSRILCNIDFLNGKTCILITHQIQYLSNVDHIVLMESVSAILL